MWSHEDFSFQRNWQYHDEYLNQKAIDEDCNMIALDAYNDQFWSPKILHESRICTQRISFFCEIFKIRNMKI